MKNVLKSKGLLLAMVIIVAVGLFGCGNLKESSKAGADGGSKGSKPKVENQTLSLLAAGDIMAHSTQINAQYDAATETYDFNNNFAYVKKYIQEADIAMCNVETVFGEGAYSGYPLFNAPRSLATAIKNAGFDVAFTANNHILDQREAGFDATIDVLRENDLLVAGTQKTGESQYAMTRVKGVDVGILAYTYETPNAGENKTINGIKVPDGVRGRLNSFQPANIDEEIPKMVAQIKAAREDGADIMVCYFHWGEEYQTTPREYQVKLANAMADAGVDVLFASHPHVLQKAEVIHSQVSGKDMPVFYSMGNYISNQRRETLGTVGNKKLTEDGLMARVTFDVTLEDGQVTAVALNKADGIFTWVNRYKNGKNVYEIIPLDGELENYESLAASGNLSKAKNAIVDSANIVGDHYYDAQARSLVVYSKDRKGQE